MLLCDLYWALFCNNTLSIHELTYCLRWSCPSQTASSPFPQSSPFPKKEKILTSFPESIPPLNSSAFGIWHPSCPRQKGKRTCRSQMFELVYVCRSRQHNGTGCHHPALAMEPNVKRLRKCALVFSEHPSLRWAERRAWRSAGVVLSQTEAVWCIAVKCGGGERRDGPKARDDDGRAKRKDARGKFNGIPNRSTGDTFSIRWSEYPVGYRHHLLRINDVKLSFTGSPSTHITRRGTWDPKSPL